MWQGSVEPPILWKRFAKYVLRKVEEQCKWRGWSIWFRGERDHECRISGLMWAGHFLADEQGFRDQLETMMNELMLKIMKLGMEQEP